LYVSAGYDTACIKRSAVELDHLHTTLNKAVTLFSFDPERLDECEELSQFYKLLQELVLLDRPFYKLQIKGWPQFTFCSDSTIPIVQIRRLQQAALPVTLPARIETYLKSHGELKQEKCRCLLHWLHLVATYAEAPARQHFSHKTPLHKFIKAKNASQVQPGKFRLDELQWVLSDLTLQHVNSLQDFLTKALEYNPSDQLANQFCRPLQMNESDHIREMMLLALEPQKKELLESFEQLIEQMVKSQQSADGHLLQDWLDVDDEACLEILPKSCKLSQLQAAFKLIGDPEEGAVPI